MTDTTDDAVTPLTDKELADLDLAFRRGHLFTLNEAERCLQTILYYQRQLEYMTTERQHTLVGCATCGRGYPPKHMVSVGDDWLCTRCAGSEIHTLRTRLSNYERKDLVATLGSEEAADRYLAFINQPNPEPPRPRRKEQP